MASSTNPPSVEQVSNLVLSDTFYTWFNVSNDIVNKINPIEVYSISADARDYTTVGADGITIDDLGQGNYRIGYIMPSNITGGHTFHQDINFAAGASGPIVNALNGVTGETTAVTTISGRSITSTVAGVANVEAVVLEINGISASTAGGLTLDLSGIASTGDLGTVLTATGGTGTFSHQTQLFFGKPEPDQLGIRIKGATHSAAVVMGGPLGTTTDADYRLSVLAGNSGASGAISVVGDEDLAPTVMLRNSGSINGEDKLTLMSGDAGGPGSIEFRIGTGLTAGQKSRVLTIADDTGTPYVGISGDLRDASGSPGIANQVLQSLGAGNGTQWIANSLFSALPGNIFFFTSGSNRSADSDFPGTKNAFYSTFNGTDAGSVQETLPAGGTYLVVGFIQGSSDAGGEDDNHWWWNTVHTATLNGGDNVKTWYRARGSNSGNIAGTYGNVESDNYSGFGIAFKLT